MRPAIVLIPLLGLAGCTGAGSGPTDTPPPPAAERDPALREESSRERMQRLERVEATGAQESVTGEVPGALLARIRGDAAARLGVDAARVEVVRAEAVTWNDGSLGCPQPDVVYTQALEPGYWVVLQAGGQKLDYRARASGYFFICEASREKGLPR